MKIFITHLFGFLLLTTLFISCGKSGPDSKSRSQDGIRGKDEYVDLDSVESEFNLRDTETTLDIGTVERIKINLFGFDDNFEIIYSKTIKPQTAVMKTYIVSKGSSYSLGSINTTFKDSDLLVNENGDFSCSISVKNRRIKALEGSCYLKIELTLPRGLAVEVYNAGKLRSRMFFAMSNEDFIAEFERASFDENRLAVIAKFKDSHRTTRREIRITTDILARILKKFPFKKMDMLKDMHAYVQDRHNLEKMIDDNFSYFDRIEAKKIVGI